MTWPLSKPRSSRAGARGASSTDVTGDEMSERPTMPWALESTCEHHCMLRAVPAAVSTSETTPCADTDTSAIEVLAFHCRKTAGALPLAASRFVSTSAARSHITMLLSSSATAIASVFGSVGLHAIEQIVLSGPVKIFSSFGVSATS